MKNLVKILFIVVVFIALSFGSAMAKEYNNPDSGISVSIPDAWKVSTEGNVFTAKTSDEGISLTFESVKAEDVEKALAEAQKEIENELGPLTTVSTSEIELNGLGAFVEDCTAIVKGAKISVSMMLIMTPDKKVVLMYYFGTDESEKKYEKELTGIVESLKPATAKK